MNKSIWIGISIAVFTSLQTMAQGTSNESTLNETGFSSITLLTDGNYLVVALDGSSLIIPKAVIDAIRTKNLGSTLEFSGRGSCISGSN